MAFLRKNFKSLNRKSEATKWVNWSSEEELKTEFNLLPEHIKNYLRELFESMTDEEKQKLKLPSKQQVMHFNNKIQKLCKTVGKTEAMNLLIKYAEKIASLKEFPESVRKYARILKEFAKKYKKNIFDARLVELWLYDKFEFENFVSGSLNAIHQEYLFNELSLGLI